LHTSLDAVPEISEYYYMTALTFFALAYVTRSDGHIAATFFTEFMTARARSILEEAILITLCAYMALLTWQIRVEAVAMTAINEVHQSARGYVPKWPGRWFLTAGSALMALYALVMGIRKLMGLTAADAPRITHATAQD
jgi:TRAP-type C4-dicarboxylate transport system permease small subunit